MEREAGGEVTEIQNPDARLTCYQVKLVKGVCAAGSPQNEGGEKGVTAFCEAQPKHEKGVGIHTNNQFGPEQLDTIKEEELCVPSTKTLAGGM